MICLRMAMTIIYSFVKLVSTRKVIDSSLSFLVTPTDDVRFSFEPWESFISYCLLFAKDEEENLMEHISWRS